MLDRVKKRHIALLILLGLLATLSIVYISNDQPKENISIRRYDQAKDFEALVAIINADLYWLSERPDFSPEKFLLWRAPNFDPSRKGQAIIDVIEVDHATAGFIAYFKKSPQHGFIWLFAIDKNFRRRGLGEKLIEHALAELKRQGAQYATLTTRLHKTPALSLYQKIGFVEESREEDRGLIILIKRNL